MTPGLVWCAMDLEPKEMDACRYSQLRYKLITGQHLPAQMVAELVADREWSRPRVDVTDDDIRASGLGDPDICDESPELIAWIEGGFDFRIDNGERRPGLWYLRNHGTHGVWEIVIEASPMAHSHIINALARACGRPPLDVLADIAATEVA